MYDEKAALKRAKFALRNADGSFFFCCEKLCCEPFQELGAEGDSRDVRRYIECHWFFRVADRFCSFVLLLKKKKILLLHGTTRDVSRAVLLSDLRSHEHGAYNLSGEKVCKLAYLQLRGLSATKLKGLMKEEKERASAANPSAQPKPHGNLGLAPISQKTRLAVRFLLFLVLAAGDYNPLTGKVHVWMFLCPETLYARFCTWAVANALAVDQLLGFRSFASLLTRGGKNAHLLKHVKFKRTVTQKICAVCGGLHLERVKLFESALSRTAPEWLAKMADWRRRSDEHFNLFWVERRCYQDLKVRVCFHVFLLVTFFIFKRLVKLANANANRRDLDRYRNISLYIMDASKPLRYHRRLFDSSKSRLLSQIGGLFSGIINHTSGLALMFTSYLPGVPVFHHATKATGKKDARTAGTNYTWEASDVNCTILLQVLLCDFRAGRLRDHLHLQVDGGADARGFTMVMLLSLLITTGYIKSATIALVSCFLLIFYFFKFVF